MKPSGYVEFPGNRPTATDFLSAVAGVLIRVRCVALIICLETLVLSAFGYAQPQSAEASQYLSKAAAAYERQDWKEAASDYSAALKVDPRDADAFARLGISYQALGMLDQAASALDHALRLKPDLPDVGILLAFIRVQEGRYPEALTLLEKGLDDADSDPPLRLRAGERLVDVCFLLGREDEGLQSLQKLKKLAPDDPDVLYAASKVYSALWKSSVERLYAKDPNSYQAHQVLASAAEAKENFAEAAKECRLVLQMQPHLPGAHYRLGMVILRQGATAEREQEALAEFQKELEVDPDDLPTHVEIGELELDLHQPEEAEKHFSRAIQLQPSDARARVDLGKLLVQKKDFEKALQQLQAAVRSAPADENAYYQLMLAYRGLGREEDAKAALANFQKLRQERVQQESKTLEGLQAPLTGEASPNP
jgi:tetratricopeptide (TPR) repeat protein